MNIKKRIIVKKRREKQIKRNKEGVDTGPQ